jgi:hypothetical protein
MSERPKYFLEKKIDDFVEIRTYFDTKWLTTSAQANDISYINNYVILMYNKLVGFINGKNNRNQKIGVTVPLTYHLKSQKDSLIDENSSCKITMRLYLPEELSDNPPKPTSADITIQTLPQSTFAVIRFGGFPSLSDYLHYRNKLIAKLGNDASKYDLFNMVIAEYDPPLRNFAYNGERVHVTSPRPNEIWLRKLD